MSLCFQISMVYEFLSTVSFDRASSQYGRIIDLVAACLVITLDDENVNVRELALQTFRICELSTPTDVLNRALDVAHKEHLRNRTSQTNLRESAKPEWNAGMRATLSKPRSLSPVERPHNPSGRRSSSGNKRTFIGESRISPLRELPAARRSVRASTNESLVVEHVEPTFGLSGLSTPSRSGRSGISRTNARLRHRLIGSVVCDTSEGLPSDGENHERVGNDGGQSFKSLIDRSDHIPITERDVLPGQPNLTIPQMSDSDDVWE